MEKMSGIDEQDTDVPICPLCKERPSFWILYPTIERTGMHGWYWLHSDEYLRENPTSDKLDSMSFEKKSTTLDEIVLVVCYSEKDKCHEFTSEHPTFQEVLQLARRLEG